MKAVAVEPDDVRGHFILGLAWLGLESFDDAVSQFEKGQQIPTCS